MTKVYRIHFATDGNDEKLKTLLRNVALTFGGYTLQTNVGGYVMKSGELCEEASYTLILAHFSCDDEHNAFMDVLGVCDEIVSTFDQESVMLEYDGRAIIHRGL